MIDSGTGFYHRYKHLIQNSSKTPFIRSSGQKRVVDSARKFIEGYQLAQADDGPTSPSPSPHHPKINVIINEGPGSNDSLNHGTCPRFESCKLGEYAELNFTSLAFAPPIRRRLESDIPGISLTDKDIIYLMDLCPFETVALSRTERDLSPFCSLFSPTEWRGYNYAKSLEKYYSFGDGNPLGPTQGVGFVNELIARLTRSPVRDSTSTNKTLDNDPVTFPVDRSLYADFSHDNPMLAVMFALRAFEGMEEELKWDRVMGVEETAGFSAAWTVPFGARLVVEGMRCGETGESGGGDDREMVRVLVNDRVAGLKCSDGLGRCRVDEFVEGLEFARDGGLWDDCFNTSD